MTKTTKSAKNHILCVDGYRVNRDALTLILEQYDYHVTSAHTQDDAIRLAQSGQFDLYIIDSWLPDGAEYDLCRLIRTFDEHTPILFYSTRDQEPGSQKALAAGAQGHLRKPTYPKRLVQTIVDLLNNAENAKRKTG